MTEGVKSAERVLAIFEVFEAERRPLRISELVKRLEIPQSSTSTLMKTLVSNGLVEFDPDHRTFQPSVRLAFLGNWVLGSTDGLAQIQTLLQKLAAETGETVIVGAQNGLNVQYLSVIVSEHQVRFALRPGMMRPLHLAGLGHMLLSQKSDDEVGRIVRRFNAEADADQALASESEVLSAVRSARALGYCETANLASQGAGVIATLLPLPIEGRYLAIGLGAPLDRLESRRELLSHCLLREVDRFAGNDDIRQVA
ncbi:MAG: IclR family transcriptional regulator [Hyphomicrobiaceae bacterium]